MQDGRECRMRVVKGVSGVCERESEVRARRKTNGG